MSDERVNEVYRNHHIVADWHDGVAKGKIWKDKVKVHDTEGSDISDTVARLKSFVDKNLKAEARNAGSTPDEARVLEAMRAILPKLHDGQLAMLKAHYHAEGQEMTATELADAAGYRYYGSANLHYGGIGKLLYELAPFEFRHHEGYPVYTFYLADAPDKPDSDGNWRWKLRPEVSKAIEELGLDA